MEKKDNRYKAQYKSRLSWICLEIQIFGRNVGGVLNDTQKNASKDSNVEEFSRAILSALKPVLVKSSIFINNKR